MAEIDGWADCLQPSLRNVWPLLAAAVEDIGGSLFGGTALAIHLRHRQSFDLDYMTDEPFETAEVAEKLLVAASGAARILSQDREGLHAVVGGVAVEVFRAPERGYNPGHVRTLETPTVIDGLRVASLPDLLASKLDVLLYRRKLRDYIDLTAIDAESPYSLEDGLLLHMARYGAAPEGFELSRIISLLEDPGHLDADPKFAKERDEILDYVKNRAPALRRHVHHQILGNADAARCKPLDRPDEAGLTAGFKQVLQDTGGLNP